MKSIDEQIVEAVKNGCSENIREVMREFIATELQKDRFISKGEFRESFGVSNTTIDNLVRDGKLSKSKLNGARGYKYDILEINRHLEENKEYHPSFNPIIMFR